MSSTTATAKSDKLADRLDAELTKLAQGQFSTPEFKLVMEMPLTLKRAQFIATQFSSLFVRKKLKEEVDALENARRRTRWRALARNGEVEMPRRFAYGRPPQSATRNWNCRSRWAKSKPLCTT